MRLLGSTPLRERSARHVTLYVGIEQELLVPVVKASASQWRAHLRELASSPRSACKVSGLVTECAQPWNVEDLSSTVEFLRATFGAERLLWGSDWPVLELAANYSRWRNASEELTRTWNSQERHDFFGGTAARFYGLQVQPSVGHGR
jgi:L-fuconolactonase